VNKSAAVVSRALLEKVLINMAMFPTVLRSDNNPAFVFGSYDVHESFAQHSPCEWFGVSPAVARDCGEYA
jgi:hypothetical protein